ncbi:MAG: TetR/AcrR family transcriptional regulator [Acidobacteria bacterium]|nr:TetR/AcrR family transcriptional regulator [Acidobacteriota bacterium]
MRPITDPALRREDRVQEFATLGREIPDELTERLFAAAFACFSEKGFERTTMDDVAARAGVARATLYYYFRGKDELFLFLLLQGVGILRGALDDAVSSSGTARERLERTLDRLIDLFVEYRDVLVVAIQQFGRIERGLGEDKHWFQEQSTGALRDLLREGAADGTLRPLDPDGTAVAIFGGMCWRVLHHVQAGGEIPVEALKSEMKAFVVGGLGV